MLERSAGQRFARLLLTAGLGTIVSGAGAQSHTPSLIESPSAPIGLYGSRNQILSYLDKNGVPTEPGKTCSETLRGGSRAGYMLSHGGVIPGSVRVSVGARSLREGIDYFLDAANGMLAFPQAISRFESVRVSYRYIESADGLRSPLGLQGLALNLKGTALSFGYGLSNDPAKGLDFTTYGLTMSSKIGPGSTLSGLFYLSTPADNRSNLLDDLSTSRRPVTRKTDPEDAASDHLILQNLNVKSGGFSIRATYQDVGPHFNGFQSMRQANAKNSDYLAQLSTLEKEKGIRRLAFGAGLSLGKKDNVSLDWDRIGDNKNQIVRQVLGFNSGSFKFAYKAQSIGAGFTRFGDLREGEREQWAREKGIDRRDLSFGFAPGPAQSFSFSQSAIGDKTGSLLRQDLALGGRGFSFAMSNRKVNKEFGRLNDLTDAEKTALALDIRRQFNAKATAAEITAKDKEQIPLESGLSRSRMSLTSALAKNSLLAFNTFDIGDGKGNIQRRTLNLTGRGLTFSYLDQTISADFSKLGKLSEFERSQFANERGIHRNAMGLNLALGKTSSLGFSQLALSDVKGGMWRRGFNYDSKGLTFKLNMANTDKSFARAADLAMPDPEKKAIEGERGYRRTDLTARITALKGLRLDTYTYQARNDSDKLDKSTFRHNLVWTPGKGTSLAFLTEGSGFEKDGKAFDRRQHDLLSIDHQFARGMKLSLFHDSLTTTQAGKEKPSVLTDFLHFETDRGKAGNLLAESKRVEYSGGKFENTTLLNLNLLAARGINFRLNKLSIDRGTDPSSDTDTIEWKWRLKGDLRFTGLVAETHTNDKTDVSTRSFGLNGPLGKSLTVAGTYSQVDQHQKNSKTAADVAISNPKPINVAGLKLVTLTAKYTAVNDQKKKQSEIAAGRIQALLGKHMLSAEYGGAIDPKGNGAIARTISFVSDKNERLPIHVDVLYKARNVNHGSLQLIRKYNLAMKFGGKTMATYSYVSLPEDAAGTMQMTKCSAFALRRDLNKTLKLSLDYTTAKDLDKKTALSKLAAAVNGSLDDKSNVQVSYSVDLHAEGEKRTDSHTLTLAYDHKMDGDHFITLGTSYVMYRHDQPDDLQVNIDCKTRF